MAAYGQVIAFAFDNLVADTSSVAQVQHIAVAAGFVAAFPAFAGFAFGNQSVVADGNLVERQI